MDLFKTEQKLISDAEFASALAEFDLKGRPVLVYSRLLSFGRLCRREAVPRLLEILVDSVGSEGTLCIPCYTFSAYNGELFDPDSSRSKVGVLGEQARLYRGFVRTIHPIYSHACWGKYAGHLEAQDIHTCFGPGSFFDLFSRLPQAFVLMLGTTLSAVTLIHFYDQQYGGPGRFVKRFAADLVVRGQRRQIEFDSCVRDYAFYNGKASCPARLDALATALKLITRRKVGGDWTHGIEEDSFERLYLAGSAVDAEYFLVTSEEECVSYYQRNDFALFHGRLDANLARAASARYSRQA